ncbi:FMN-dependent NADH-azoreductase [Mucilaginibacter sp. HD30]
MKNILMVTSSASGENSNSNWLASLLVEKLSAGYEDLAITARAVGTDPLPYLNAGMVNAIFLPEDLHSETHRASLQLSSSLIAELMSAEVIIIGLPMYNFGIPAALKSWLDHIVRPGKTFNYTEKGVEGLVRGKSVLLAISTGGNYTDGPLQAFDFTESYLVSVLNFIGINDIKTFRIEGTAIPGGITTARAKAEQQVEAAGLINEIVNR